MMTSHTRRGRVYAVALVLLPGVASLLVPPVVTCRAPAPCMLEKMPPRKPAPTPTPKTEKPKPRDALISAIGEYDTAMTADANRRTVVSSAAGIVFGVGFSKLVSTLGDKLAAREVAQAPPPPTTTVAETTAAVAATEIAPPAGKAGPRNPFARSQVKADTKIAPPLETPPPLVAPVEVAGTGADVVPDPAKAAGAVGAAKGMYKPKLEVPKIQLPAFSMPTVSLPKPSLPKMPDLMPLFVAPTIAIGLFGATMMQPDSVESARKVRETGEEPAQPSGDFAEVNEVARFATMAKEEEQEKQSWIASLQAPASELATKAVNGVKEGATQVVNGAKLKAKAEATRAAESAKAKAKDTAKAGAKAILSSARGFLMQAQAQAAEKLGVECDEGDASACETLSKEEAAKRAWLESIEMSAVDKGLVEEGRERSEAPFVDEITILSSECEQGDTVACDALTDEQEAKEKWLVKIEEPVVAQVVDMLHAECKSGDVVACDAISKEENAKNAWLSRIEEPKPAIAYDDVAAKHVTTSLDYGAVQVKNNLAVDCNAGDVKACDTLSKEEKAKRAWLNRVEERPSMLVGGRV